LEEKKVYWVQGGLIRKQHYGGRMKHPFQMTLDINSVIEPLD
jgi:hypothetical protein